MTSPDRSLPRLLSAAATLLERAGEPLPVTVNGKCPGVVGVGGRAVQHVGGGADETFGLLLVPALFPHAGQISQRVGVAGLGGGAGEPFSLLQVSCLLPQPDQHPQCPGVAGISRPLPEVESMAKADSVKGGLGQGDMIVSGGGMPGGGIPEFRRWTDQAARAGAVLCPGLPYSFGPSRIPTHLGHAGCRLQLWSGEGIRDP
jgi:hypothetical protein